jgi:predicted NBD/HSP70 family sugar kinase
MLQKILDLIWSDGPISRAELARRLGISKPTASTLVQILKEANLVVETGIGETTGGRKPVLFDLNSTAGYVVGMDIGGTSARAVLADLRGNIIASCRKATQHSSKDGLLSQLLNLKAQLAAQQGIAEDDIISVAIGTPGVIDPQNQQVRYAPNLRALEEAGFLHELQEALGTTVSLHNDVNLAALGEKWRGACQDTGHFIFISIGTGLGFGLMLDHQLYQGFGGRAGEYGYLPFPPGSETSLEEVLSGPALARRHAELGGAGSSRDAFAEADAGEEPGKTVIAEMVEHLAWLICSLATLLDPATVVLGGGVGGRCHSRLADIMTATQRMSPIVPTVVVSELGEDAGLLGAVCTALQASRSVDEWLKGGEKETLLQPT